MSSGKLLFAYSTVVCWVIGAGAIPAPTSTVTIYAVPFGTGNPTPLVGGTHGVDVSVLGVSSGFAGTETTYSIGEYVSYPASTSVVVTITSGSDTETTTVPVQNSIVYTENLTLIESSGGFRAIQAASSSGTTTRNGFVEDCVFNTDGGSNLPCVLAPQDPTALGVITDSTIEASKVLLTVMTVASTTSPSTSSPTSSPTNNSSNAAGSNFQGSYVWRSGLFTLACYVFLVVL